MAAMQIIGGLIMFDFYRVATIVPDLKVANVHYNKDKIAQKLTEA